MANIPFTTTTITDGVTPVNKTVMQPVFDAVDKIVDKTKRGALEYLDANLVSGTTPGARGLTALEQATTLNADTVSGYGIGTTAMPQFTGNIDTGLNNSGLFSVMESSTGTKPSGIDGGFMQVYIYGANDQMQVLTSYSTTPRTFVRVKATNWGAWYEIWNASSDGNDGQPPAPKPTTAEGSVGEWDVAAIEDQNTTDWTNPGGTWAYNAIKLNKTSGVLGGAYAGVSSGNIAGLSGAGFYVIFWLWRIA